MSRSIERKDRGALQKQCIMVNYVKKQLAHVLWQRMKKLKENNNVQKNLHPDVETKSFKLKLQQSTTDTSNSVEVRCTSQVSEFEK